MTLKISKKYLQKLIEEETKAVLEENNASWLGAEIFGASEDAAARQACLKVSKALDSSRRRLKIALKAIRNIENALPIPIQEGKRWSWKDPFGNSARKSAMAKLDRGIKEHDRDWNKLFDMLRALQKRLEK